MQSAKNAQTKSDSVPMLYPTAREKSSVAGTAFLIYRRHLPPFVWIQSLFDGPDMDRDA